MLVMVGSGVLVPLSNINGAHASMAGQPTTSSDVGKQCHPFAECTVVGHPAHLHGGFHFIEEFLEVLHLAIMSMQCRWRQNAGKLHCHSSISKRVLGCDALCLSNGFGLPIFFSNWWAHDDEGMRG